MSRQRRPGGHWQLPWPNAARRSQAARISCCLASICSGVEELPVAIAHSAPAACRAKERTCRLTLAGHHENPRENKATLLTYRNNFVPASEPWLAENRQPTLRQTQLSGLGSQHTLSHYAVSSPSGYIQCISESPIPVFPVIQQRPLVSQVIPIKYTFHNLIKLSSAIFLTYFPSRNSFSTFINAGIAFTISASGYSHPMPLSIHIRCFGFAITWVTHVR